MAISITNLISESMPSNSSDRQSIGSLRLAFSHSSQSEVAIAKMAAGSRSSVMFLIVKEAVCFYVSRMRAKSVLWTREHLLVAMNLYCKLPFGSFDRGNPLIQEVAEKMGRSANSLAMKLSNLTLQKHWMDIIRQC